MNGHDDSDLAALCHAIGVIAAANHADLRAGGGRALPGAVEAIAALAAQPGVVQSVLTGNIRSLGVVKLDAVGLLDPLDLAVAAFGDDHIARADLVSRGPGAVQRPQWIGASAGHCPHWRHTAGCRGRPRVRRRHGRGRHRRVHGRSAHGGRCTGRTAGPHRPRPPRRRRPERLTVQPGYPHRP